MPAELRLDGLRDLSRLERDDGARRTRVRTASRERSPSSPPLSFAPGSVETLRASATNSACRRVLHALVDALAPRPRVSTRMWSACTVVNSSARCSYWARSSVGPDPFLRDRGPNRIDRQDPPARARRGRRASRRARRVPCSARRLRTAPRAARRPPRRPSSAAVMSFVSA